MARSLNKVIIIGNLTRDPELRYTPQGTAVCTFGVATNREWTTDGGEKREEAEFHRIVVWNKLAEICSQMLFKGSKVYLEGRLQTRTWTGTDQHERTTTEIVVSDMIKLDSRRGGEEGFEMTEKMAEEIDMPEESGKEAKKEEEDVKKDKPKEKKEEKVKDEKAEVNEDDIPF